jgi:tetratricopeptide (TPR) repeat protein
MIDDLKRLVNGQRILIISPKYFGYSERIVEAVKSYGAFVVMIDGRPDNSFFTKIILRYFPFVYKGRIRNYYEKSIDDIFDQILIINPEYLSANIIRALREKTNASRVILYMWDSLLNKKNVVGAIKYFDRVLTFDPNDAKRLHLFFRPLFFSSKNRDKKNINEIDVSFIGTGHSDRAEILEKIKKQCIALNMKYYLYLYLQSKIVFYFHKITNKNFKNIKASCFHYRPLDYDRYIEISKSSKIIVDIEHRKQKGLTMRTFEVLGNEKKLITTNKSIRDYDFYNPLNILIIDRKNPIIDKHFINTDYRQLPTDIYYKYSLEGWLEDIFAETVNI